MRFKDHCVMCKDMKPSGSYSAPLRSPSQRPASLPPVGFDEEERAKFMLEIERAKRDLDRFRNEMAGLAKQMDGMAVDLVSVTSA